MAVLVLRVNAKGLGHQILSAKVLDSDSACAQGAPMHPKGGQYLMLTLRALLLGVVLRRYYRARVNTSII